MDRNQGRWGKRDQWGERWMVEWSEGREKKLDMLSRPRRKGPVAKVEQGTER